MWDLPNATDVSLAFGSILTGFAAMLGALAAWRGLSVWKAQELWRGNHDLARSLAVGIKKREDAIAHVRNPFSWAGEAQIAQDTPEYQRRQRQAEAKYQARWDKLVDARQSIYELEMEASVLWQGEFDASINKLNRLENELNIAISEYIEDLSHEHSGEPSPDERERSREIRRTIFSSYEKDEFGEKYKSAVETALEFLRSKMERK